MIRLQIRIRPVHSLLDVDPPGIGERLRALPAVEGVEVFDDRASDAPFVTVLVTLASPSDSALRSLQESLLGLEKVLPCVVDEHGDEFGCGSLEMDVLRRHARDIDSSDHTA